MNRIFDCNFFERRLYLYVRMYDRSKTNTQSILKQTSNKNKKINKMHYKEETLKTI
jgi:hypothetical protein